MASISQRISLEGSDDIKKKLLELGQAGEKAFKQIQNAAAKPITDQAAIERTRQSFDQLSQAVSKLSPQFRQLTTDTQQFGSVGAQAGQKTAAGLDQASSAAEKTSAGFKSAAQEANNLGIRIGVISGLVQAATNELIGMVGQLRAALSPGALLQGTVETGKAIGDQAEKLKLTVPEWLKLSKAIAAAGVSEEKFIEGTSKLAKTIADAKGGFVELVPGQLVSTSKGAVAVLQDLAAGIARLGNSASAARQGTRLFGENWKEIVKALTGSKAAADAADDVFDKLAKVDRAMRPDQAEKAAQLAKAWDVLGKAIRAAKDQIGTVFLDSALLRAEWLIRLIDGSRELFKTWQQLADEKKAAFLEGLGTSPTEMLFKTLVAVSQLLAGIWRDVLVPAGKTLMGIIGEIANSFEGVTKSQVAAFFITAAAAAVGLVLAFKGLSLLLTPLSILLSAVFSPFGAVLLAAAAAVALFWDKLKAGAATVAALIPIQLQDIADSLKKLFAGDFAGFWDQFSFAAVEAFGKIRAAAEQDQGVIGELFRGLQTIIKDLPEAILLVVKVFIGLGVAATKVAGQINKMLGTELTGTDIGLLLIVGNMTGALQLLATAAIIAGAGLGILATAFTLLGQAIKGVALVAGGLVTLLSNPIGLAVVVIVGLLVAGLILLIKYWPQVKEAAADAWAAIQRGARTTKQFLDTWIGTPVGNAWQWVVDTFWTAVNWVKSIIDQATTWINAWIATPIANAWQWITDTFRSAVGGLQSMMDTVTGWIRDFVTTPIANAWQWITDTFSAAMKGIMSGGGGTPGETTPAPEGFARGGFIGGRGSGTSDSNLAWVSRGEHIMPAAAVRQPGVLAFLEALRRSGGDLRRLLDGMGRFALGGPVGLPVAVGGLSRAGAGRDWGTINLLLSDGSQVTGMVERTVFETLKGVAVKQQLRSGGRKPSRYT